MRSVESDAMPATFQELGIGQLSVDERMELVQAIWDSIASNPPPSFISEAQRSELDARMSAHAADPTDVVPWEQIKSEALARFGT